MRHESNIERLKWRRRRQLVPRHRGRKTQTEIIDGFFELVPVSVPLCFVSDTFKRAENIRSRSPASLIVEKSEQAPMHVGDGCLLSDDAGELFPVRFHGPDPVQVALSRDRPKSRH